MAEIDDLVPKAARNEMFYFVARAAMLLATGVGLPVAAFMMTRIISQADALQLSVSQQNVDIKVLSAIIKEKQDTNVNQLTDHELRLRTLERGRQN